MIRAVPSRHPDAEGLPRYMTGYVPHVAPKNARAGVIDRKDVAVPPHRPWRMPVAVGGGISVGDC